VIISDCEALAPKRVLHYCTDNVYALPSLPHQYQYGNGTNGQNRRVGVLDFNSMYNVW